ncbi:MAG: tRNA dihydrouridine synthase DusB [Syntrophales bacterium]|nr:tRNA dihydrouridine synthase DusB [Syntrophales bacterium]
MLYEMNIGTLSLGNNIFLAPMAGVTDLPFRLLARTFGAGLCFTEMVSAQGLVRKTRRSYEYLASSPNDRPLGVQLFGADPDILGEAAAIVTELGADLIDINAGCPVRKVLKTGAGGALMRDPARFSAVLGSVRAATHLPLTVKIRSGWAPGEINAVDIAERAEGCGADALTLHPRTVRQGFSGSADWHLIGLAKERVRIPIIGSGDIRGPEDARAMLEQAGCDGVMVGRGSMGNPWIFRAATAFLSDGTLLPPPDSIEREDILRQHLKMHMRQHGKTAGVRGFRTHLLWYTKGLRGGSTFRKAAVSVEGMDELLEMVHAYLHHFQGED